MMNTNYYDYMRVKDLKDILNGLPDDMIVIIPVIDEDDVNHIFGFRKVRTAGILRCEGETEDERDALCLNSTADGQDIADQVYNSGVDVDAVVNVVTVLYGKGENND